MTALYRPSAQVKKGDRFLDQARNLRDKWKDLIPSGDLVTLQNRITLASEMRVGLDSKSGLSKISHARTYRKYTLETLRIVKATSDRARDANVIIINDETQEEQRQRIVGVAETIYRSFFGYKDPFPTPEQESIWVKSVWAMACVKTGTEMSLSTDLAEKLAKAGPRFRDDIKKRVTPLVERHYKFVTNKSPESFNENAELSRRLKTDAYFSDTTEGKLGLPYRHPIIQQVINIVWFNDRSGDGVVFSNNFNPMPYETIALVLTVIECCIDEWRKGLWEEIPFTHENYKNVYYHHLDALKGLTDQGLNSRKCDPLHQLRHDICNAGRDHAGVPRLPRNGRRLWSQDRVNAACDGVRAV